MTFPGVATDDAWEWRPHGVLLAQHPEYPVVPESGERYPL